MSDQSTEDVRSEKVEFSPPDSIGQGSLDQKISTVQPEDLDSVTTNAFFRTATAKLLAGSISFAEWEWFASKAFTRHLNLPDVREAVDQDAFAHVFEVFGAALEGLLSGGSGTLDEVTEDDAFRSAVLDLLQSDMTVPQFVDIAGTVINEAVDVQTVPESGEDVGFERGLMLLASALHGLLTEGTGRTEP